MQYFTILQYKLHSFNIQDDRSTWAFSETVKNISKIPYTASKFSFLLCRVFECMNIKLRFNIIKNLLCLFFIWWFYRFVIFKSVWYARHFSWVLLLAMFMNDWKKKRHSEKKLQERQLTINKRNIIQRLKNIQRQQFSFTNKSVSKNPESWSLKLKFTF